MNPDVLDVNAYFNGEYMPLSHVSISPLDRGFLLGDGVYEAIPAYNGTLLAGEWHWQRLLNGLQSAGINPGLSAEDLNQIAAGLMDAGEPESLLYIQITRGAEAMRKHRFPVTSEPTILMFPIAFSAPISLDYDGCSAWFQDDLRWQRCSIKSISLMGNVLAYRQLFLDGVASDEALLVRDGNVVEAPSSNVFIVSNSEIITPPLDNILPGVTRNLVIALARSEGYVMTERAISKQEVQAADEIWVTNSMEELKPVVMLEGKPVGDGRPGAIWQQLYTAFQALK